MKTLLSSLLLCLATLASAQAPNPNTALPLDPAVRAGKLANGLTYYIRKNKKPENRMELRLAVNAGSVLEDDDQQGLAHFAEHMAFNGSEHFQKNDLVNYLESIGVRFGADLNAYTSFDETVYMLQLPTDTASIVDKGFTVLEDWAHNVSYDNTEIDKERGVVIEEWRLGRGADARMEDKQFPILFQGSKYAERLPIGKKPILESFKYDAVKRFYKDWYRPNLQAVIAVGDFDVDQIEKLIKQHFEHIPAAVNPKPRTMTAVPDVTEPRFAIASDPEASESAVGVMFKVPILPATTVGEYRARIVQSLYNRMFNARLGELTQQADPPFSSAFSSRGRWVRGAEFYSLDATVKNNEIGRGLETLLTEAARVKQFGFTATELEREKTSALRSMDQRYDEREKTDSRVLVNQLVAKFLRDEPVPGIAAERDLYRAIIPTITIEEVNALSATLITPANRVITANTPEKPGVTVPTKEELATIYEAASKRTVTAYVDRVVNTPLVEHPPVAQTVKDEQTIPELGVTLWTLGNGVRVVLKPTDFKNDEVLMTAFRPGGTSTASDADYLSADEAAEIIGGSGVGAFDQTTLKKALSGKIASVSPNFSDTHDLLRGSASPKDLQTFFELVYLYFTAPRKDSTEFESYLARSKGFLQNRNASPRAAFMDTVKVTLGSYHPRSMPFTEASLTHVDLTKAYDFYRTRFGDANGFTFVFVGNFTPASIKPMVETWLGGLPTQHRTDSWKDLGMHPPKGVVEKAVHKGIEPKSSVLIEFTGPYQWSAENRWKLQSLCTAVNIKLREQLREEKGGVYGVSTFPQMSHQPRDEYGVMVSFPCAPNRVDELTKQAMLIIDSVQKFGVEESYVHKIKELQLRDRETSLKQNQFWLGALQQYYQNNDDPRVLLKYNDMVATLSSETIRDAAKQYFDMNNYVKVALYPEN